jgi:hypothetical protein
MVPVFIGSRLKSLGDGPVWPNIVSIAIALVCVSATGALVYRRVRAIESET